MKHRYDELELINHSEDDFGMWEWFSRPVMVISGGVLVLMALFLASMELVGRPALSTVPVSTMHSVE